MTNAGAYTLCLFPFSSGLVSKPGQVSGEQMRLKPNKEGNI